MITKAQLPENMGVLMVGFNPIVNQGLESVLSQDERIQVIAEVPDALEAVKVIKQSQTDGRQVSVVLTETKTPTIDGVQVAKLIKREFPEVAVLVLTENPDDSCVIDAIQSGAAGYIFLNDATPEILVQSIYGAVEGCSQISSKVLRSAVDHYIQNGGKTVAERRAEAAHLTDREIEVLELLGRGDSNKAIAETLGISLDTTKKHVRNVIDKLQAHGRTHAAIIAAQSGIVGNPANGRTNIVF
jgi:DNA-binding NarL/FixJ family response regulator